MVEDLEYEQRRSNPVVLCSLVVGNACYDNSEDSEHDRGGLIKAIRDLAEPGGKNLRIRRGWVRACI